MKEEDLRKMGARIKKLREEKGWTQAVLGSRLKVSQSYITGLERGVYKPGNPMLVALSDLFNVPITDLDPDTAIGLEENNFKG